MPGIGGRITLDKCLVCVDLTRALQVTLASYVEARSAAFYRVCTDIAAKREVDMERAKTDLQEHRLVCPSELNAAPQTPSVVDVITKTV